jgi:hypothetical protein
METATAANKLRQILQLQETQYVQQLVIMQARDGVRKVGIRGFDKSDGCTCRPLLQAVTCVALAIPAASAVILSMPLVAPATMLRDENSDNGHNDDRQEDVQQHERDGWGTGRRTGTNRELGGCGRHKEEINERAHQREEKALRRRGFFSEHCLFKRRSRLATHVVAGHCAQHQ